MHRVTIAWYQVLNYLKHPDQSSDGRGGVQGELADIDLHDGEVDELVPGDEHEEEDERDDGEYQHQDAHEQALVCTCAVHGVVVRVPLVGWRGRQSLAPGPRPCRPLGARREGRQAADVLPHHVQDGGADQRVLDGAGEQEGTRVLHQGPHDVGTPALVDVVWAFEAPGHPVVR